MHTHKKKKKNHHRNSPAPVLWKMSSTSYADAAKKALKPKSKLVGTTPIQSMFKQVVSFKALPDCSTAGCKHKAKFGYEAPALACSAHKLEGMHEISILKMNLQPTEPISAASILVSPPEILPSARVGELNESTASRVSSKDTRSPTTSDVLVDDIYHSGMQLNLHWIENNGQKPKKWYQGGFCFT